MLQYSSHIQEYGGEQFTRHADRRYRGSVGPIHTHANAEACLALFSPQAHDSWFAALPGLRAQFCNSGHLPGPALVEIEPAQLGARARLCGYLFRPISARIVSPGTRTSRPDRGAVFRAP